MTEPIADWETLAASKRSAVSKKIPLEWRLPSSLTSQISSTSTLNVLDVPRECGILTSNELDLTEKYDATDLVDLMSSGKVKSYDVTLAFCKRAAIAQQLVNCCTEIMFDEALVRARQCDDYLANEGKPMGPFHGLPISLKDSFNVKGTQTTIGYVSFLAHPPAASNSILVDILFRHGAVFYVKTNLPQSMMTADSHNNIFGRTLNPNKLCLTAGGSTGGEGALIKLRGSIMGLATDIAGSNRIPALCNGISSFKPTAGRIPFGRKVPPGRIGSPGSILPVIGPEGHSVRDYELFMRTVIDSEPWDFDENTLNVPWRRVELFTRPLKFGLIRGHPKRPLHPTIARALHSAATVLKEAGHSVVLLDDKIPDLYETGMLAYKYFMLDPKATPKQYVDASGEPWVPSIKGANFPELAGWKPSLDDVWEMNVERAKVLKVYHDLVVENRLDAILMPGYQATAVPHDTYGLALYTVLQNLLNYPAGILPYLQANRQLDEPFINKEANYEPLYDPDTFEGAPGAVQIVGKPMKDEELVEILKVVERVLNKP
ncbi:amidase signature domain-containing protein [Clohesyomyces aquaticus]|uniref:Amidase signature domain-containing protein n=1 Tax=Clohesyomyces aquaticus TaxID=1231657 RepID=A0A1Y1ZK37_9PLEO|nr:amidase signature domain-containing protein [Clohesyomyces aquaticus]